MADTDTIVINNARIVLADQVIEGGYMTVENGRIAEIGEGTAPERGVDFGGDLLLPGLVELHTDHLEAHVMPRPKVHWDTVAAVISYDAQIATSGITTVLDSLRVWREEGAEEVDGQAGTLSLAIGRARAAGLLRIEHFLHLRCEIPMPNVVGDAAELIGRPDVRLMSLMDHTPGQRQFRDPVKLREYYRGKSGGMSDAELDSSLCPPHRKPCPLRGAELPGADRTRRRARHAAREPRRHDVRTCATGHSRPCRDCRISDHDGSRHGPA